MDLHLLISILVVSLARYGLWDVCRWGGAILGKIVLGFAALILPSLNCNPQSLGNHSGQVPIPQSANYGQQPTSSPLGGSVFCTSVWGIFAFRMRLADFGKLKFEPEWL